MTTGCPRRPALVRLPAVSFCVLLTLALTATLTTPVRAEEGRIPIWEPTTITQSGRYIVTRDIGDVPSAAPPRAITISANFVDIDLNGFTLRTGEAVILAQDVRNITIHNGKIESYEDAIRFINVNTFVIRQVQIQSFEDPAVVVSGAVGRLEANQIEHSFTGIVASGTGIVVQRNEIRGGFQGIQLQGCSGCTVAENTLANGSGILVDLTSSGNLIAGNVLSSAAITVDGPRNQIAENLISGYSGFGLSFSGSSSDNVYRSNTARGNGGTGCTSPPDFCDQGTSNTTHGDNYLPGLQ